MTMEALCAPSSSKPLGMIEKDGLNYICMGSDNEKSEPWREWFAISALRPEQGTWVD